MVLFVGCLFERQVLEMKGALYEPLVLRHSLDEHVFGVVGRLMVGYEAGEHSIVLVWIFGLEEMEGAREAVAEIILGRGGFAFRGFGTGAVLGVCLG